MMFADLVSIVFEYLADVVTVEQLEDWMVPRLVRLFEVPDSPVAQLAATIELGLAEIDDGVIEEEEFRTCLQAAIGTETQEGLLRLTVMDRTESSTSPPLFIGTRETMMQVAWRRP